MSHVFLLRELLNPAASGRSLSSLCTSSSSSSSSSSSPQVMSMDDLEKRIRLILSAPGTDLETISAKRVRKQLLHDDPALSDQWMKEHKQEVDRLIATIFEEVAAHVQLQNGGAVAGRADHAGDVADSTVGANGKAYADEQGDDGEAGPSTPPPKSKKPKGKKELTDEQYARQLANELNATQRSSRSGKAPTVKPKKGASRTPKKDKKSAERVVDSDADSDREGDGKKPKRKAGGGFQKEFLLSAPLATLLQQDRLSRPQCVKQLWVHIKGNNLQNPENKKEILCDDLMRAVFGTSKIDMFAMNKVLGNHLLDPADTAA